MSRTFGLSVAAALLLTGIGVAPAYADISPPGVTLDAPTAGHITGTVTSDQPYVAVRLQGNVPATFVPMVDGSGQFDLETWGYGPGPQTVEAAACDGNTPGTTCSALQTSGVEFTPIDVVPDITWPDDSTIGPGQDASVTVSDPDGGGVLWAMWNPHQDPGVTGTQLDRFGTTVLDLPDGDGEVSLVRCASANAFNCAPVTPAVSHPLSVHRSLAIDMTAPDPITTAHPDSAVTFDTDRTGTYTVTWKLLKIVEDVPVEVPGSGGTATGDLDGSGATAPITIAGAELTDGTYTVTGSITVVTPTEPADQDYGTFSDVAIPEGLHVLMVDKTGPNVSVAASPKLIYPRIRSSKYPGTTNLAVTGTDSGAVTALRLKSGATVVTLPSPVDSWNGTTNGSTPAPGGTYSIFALDADGNSSGPVGQVTVSPLRIVTKTWTKVMTARSSMAAFFVGKCSTLRRPSARGWAGSIGYYANTKCANRSWTSSGVTTAHAIVLPKVDQLVDIRVDAYGAAARKKPRSHGLIRYLTTNGNWVSIRPIGRTLGWHNGYTRSTSGVVFKDNSFGWSFAASAGNRYDVAKFRVTLHYKGLG